MFRTTICLALGVFLTLGGLHTVSTVIAQESTPADESAATGGESGSAVDKVKDVTREGMQKASELAESARQKTGELAESAKKKTGELAEQVDANEQAQEAAAGILQPIYALAESFEEFSAFYWVAFLFMATGVVNFALQLVLGKLVALTRGGFSLSEILSDALGLIISLVGLVLTTQAATENSSFTSSAAAVLSASVLGIIVGFTFYLWGQRQELQAIEARKAQARKE